MSTGNNNTATVAFRWDHVGLVISYTLATAYSYDQLYRLTGDGTRTYGYDPVGNRLSLTQGTTTSYTYDKADRIQTVGGQTYTVDANGNLTSFPSNALAYDQANRLKTATISGTTTTYAYDGDGKRASKTVGLTTTSYVYDANGSLPNVLTDGSRKYVYGLGLAYATDTTGNVQAVYHADGLGSVRALTDASGNLVATYQTDPFGVPTQTQGSSSQPFGYTGQQQDAESSFVFLRARYYDPALGRFLSRDTVVGSVADPLSLNLFTYAQDNPVEFTDPSGKCFVPPAAVFCAIEGGTLLAGAAVIVTVGVNRVMSDPYVQENIREWANDRFGYVPNLIDAASEQLQPQDPSNGNPPVKTGSSGGPTAGQAFPDSVKERARQENPQGICVYCRLPGADQIDHVIPRSRGGNATLDNAQRTCSH
jgi:RHS repeat-associated protein